jgi:ABC-type lipoprotein release transport system permease subunit
MYYTLERRCNEYYNDKHYYNSSRYNPTSVYLSDEDYANALLGFGETHPVAQAEYYYSTNDKYYYGSSSSGIVLHSYDPEATEAYLRECFPELPPNDPEVNYYDFVTPEFILATELQYSRTEIISSIVALAAGLLLMCICIYFIMRSSMLSKVREIGIWRAVGVSKKNMIFKFAIESTAIALQTLAIGFAIGAYLANSLASGGVTATTFYFPFWLGALTLAFLVLTCILFGILPIAALLRKSPAQILAKYDI